MAKPSPLSLTDDELQRYGRHVILPEMGEEKQARLLKSRVLAVGAGGLGSASLFYLAAAGIGEIAIIDHDTVDIGNLQRQIIHGTYDVGRAKTESAAEALQDLNPDCRITAYRERLNKDNAAEFVKDYDIVIDGSDNFAARQALAEACALAEKPLVSAAVVRMEGQITTFKPYLKGEACYHCLYPDVPDAATVARCDTVGILGPVAGLLGTCQAVEAIKELVQIGDGLTGRLLLIDAFAMRFYEVKLKQSPDCHFCASLDKKEKP